MSATPILDLETDPPSPSAGKWRTLIPLGIGAAIGATSSLAGNTFSGLPALNPILMIPAVYVAVAIHEFGHLAAGKSVGMAAGGIVIGGFVFMKSGERWIFRFMPRAILGGGLAKPLPPKGEFRPLRFAWMVAGGPLASLLLTLVCGFIALRYGSGAYDWIGTLCWAGALTLLSLLPLSSGINRSDGSRLWMLIVHPERSSAWMAALRIQTEETRGVRPRDWDADLFEEMLTGDPAANELPYRQLLAYYRKADLGDNPAALEHLEKALASSGKSGKVVRQALYLEAALASALIKGNVGQARTWRERGLKLRKPELIDGVDAAIALGEGRYEDSLRRLAAARSWIAKRRLDSGLVRYGNERLAEMESQCLAHTLAPGGSPALTWDSAPKP